MRGQINALPMIMIFMAIAIVAISTFVFLKTSETNEAVDKIEYTNFVNNIQTQLREYAFSHNIGSSEKVSFNVPGGMERVCFVEQNGRVDKYSYTELEVQRGNQIDKNVFFFPKDYPAKQIKHMELKDNPLCVEPKRQQIELELVSKGNRTQILTNEKEDKTPPKCSVLYNGEGEEKIDVVFLGLRYEENEKLSEDATRYINNVFGKVEPFKSNKEKFNFFQVNKPVKNCKITSYIKCNNQEIKKLASSCPNDYIIILAERSNLVDMANPVRSSAVSNLVKINTADNPLVVAHEFGHVFGGLADEYVDQSYYSQFDLNAEELPNCAEYPCEKWDEMSNTNCYKGCSVNSFYRPTKNSIMRYYYKDGGETFGPVNIKALKEKIEES